MRLFNGRERFGRRGRILLLAIITAAAIRLWMQFFAPSIWWHQAGFFLLFWWLIFLLARLALRRYWSFWLALAVSGGLWLRFMGLDNWWTLVLWLGAAATFSRLLDKP